MGTILFVDDMKTVRDQFKYDIERKTGLTVVTASNGEEALKKLSNSEIDTMILDIEMPVMDGLEVLEKKAQMDLDDIPVIVYTGKGDFQKCVKAVKLGAFNFFDKEEVKLDQLVQSINNALEIRKVKLQNKELLDLTDLDSPIIGNSAAIEGLKKQIVKVGQIPSNVLIIGESGTGKELVAREIHNSGPRSEEPFVALNCAALPENLVESELFGFEKGAFSGAAKTTKGKFEAADKGTLFLDEIGDMPVNVQAKLLRVLETMEVSRIGSEGRSIKIDVRVIAATHKDLEKLISENKFRQDLYYRMCTQLINVPPLRNRLEDVAPLTHYFIKKTCKNFGLPEKQASPEVIHILQNYLWEKNNVRELQNTVARMIISCEGNVIKPEHVPVEIRNSEVETDVTKGKSFQELKRDAEKRILFQYLEKFDWHISKTADALKISNHSNLLKIMRRLGLKKPQSE